MEMQRKAEAARRNELMNAVNKQIVAWSDWHEDGKVTVVAVAKHKDVKPEIAEAVLCVAENGNPLLEQWCVDCNRVYMPEATKLFGCPRCKLTLREVEYDVQHKVYRALPPDGIEMALPGCEENAKHMGYEAPHVLTEKLLKLNIQKNEKLGFQFDPAAETLLCAAIENFVAV